MLTIEYLAETGLSLVATLQRKSDSRYWNDVSEAWEVSPSFANKSITITESTGDYTGYYSGSPTGDLGSPGRCGVFLHNTDVSNQVVGLGEVYIDMNVEVSPPNLVDNQLAISNSASGNGTTTTFAGSTGLSTEDNFYRYLALVWTSGNNKGVTRLITAYVGSSLTFTLDRALPSAVSASDKFKILGYIPPS